MKIDEFIEDWRNKRIIANVSLPKYQYLLTQKLDEKIDIENKENVDGDSINWTMTVGKKNNTIPGQVPEHFKDILEKDYTYFKNFLLDQEKGIKNFNNYISTYLKKESGWSIDFKTRGERPGTRRSFNFTSTARQDIEMILSEGYIPSTLAEYYRPKWYQRLLGVFSNSYFDTQWVKTMKKFMWGRQPKNTEQKLKLTLEDFFNNIKIKIDSSEEYKNHINYLLKKVQGAKSMNQTSLLEILGEKLIVGVYEGALIASNYKKYVTFEDLKTLEERAPRGISIDLVEDYTRVIPEDVIEKKFNADQLMIFDQYVILHFDPHKKNSKKSTEKIEDEKKKDPILFGLLFGSEKLYYIADWVDEYCDLTWDKAMEILGEEDENRELSFKK